jgi:hypothetical protein
VQLCRLQEPIPAARTLFNGGFCDGGGARVLSGLHVCVCVSQQSAQVGILRAAFLPNILRANLAVLVEVRHGMRRHVSDVTILWKFVAA